MNTGGESRLTLCSSERKEESQARDKGGTRVKESRSIVKGGGGRFVIREALVGKGHERCTH